jgi:Holliday junction resolvase-like predicted endonuclease
MYNPLHSYAFNRFVKYENPLNESDHNTWIEWYTSHLKNMIKHPEHGCFPFIEEIENSLQEGIDKVSGGRFPRISGDIFSMFSFKLKAGSGNCYRFVIPFYQFDDKPFINIGKLKLSPTMFFANMDFFYLPLNKALKSLSNSSNEQKMIDSSEKFEESIVSAINRNFNGKFAKRDFDTGHGEDNLRSDIDIIVKDEKSVVLIQVKRTKFRLNLEEQYKEFINVDRKASRQINNAIKEFSQKFGFDIGDRNVYKWIVSSSFERSYQRINGCLKVPVFDIFMIEGRNTFVSVAEFAESVESHEE